MSRILERCENNQKITLELCDECNKVPQRIKNPQCNQHVFESRADMKKSLARVCYGDLYVIGRLWIVTLQSVLVGHKLSLIPVVKAAEEKPPQRPPPMKFKDLSIYNSPHYDYKEFEEDKLKCPKYKVKLMHEKVLPHVKNYRRETVKTYNEYKSLFDSKCKEICGLIKGKKDEFKSYMRSPENLAMGRCIVAAAAATGYIVGRRMGRHGDSVLRGIFCSGLGALATGALCFPKETDENFRSFCYESGKIGYQLLSIFCNANYGFKEKAPCDKDIPEKPPQRPDQCPKKK